MRVEPTPSTTTTPPTSDSPTPDGSTESVPPTAPAEPADSSQVAELADVAAGLPGSIVRRSTDGSLVVSAPDGSDGVTWSAREDGVASQPTWSADGSQLAWTVLGPNGVALALAQINAGPDATIVIPVSTPIFYYSWSPSGDWLAGLRNSASGLELTMVDVESQLLRVVGPGQPFFTDWNSDDALVAAIGGTILADVPASETESPSQRALQSPLGVFQAPIVLGNDDVIVTLRRGDQNDVVRLRGSEATTIASAEGPVAMSIDPLGERLAVLVAPDDEPELISFQTTPLLESGRVSIIDLRTGDVEIRPETNTVAINWSPTGDKLAMLEATNLTMSWLFAEPGAVAERSAQFIPSREFVTAYVPFADQYDRSSTWWSPDGEAFVFAGSINGQEGIWIDRLTDGLGPAFLAPGDIAFWSN